MLKPPKNDLKYSWTNHVWMKMQYYGISEGRIKRIIRFPKRTEGGIAPDTVAVMQPADTKRYSEIWVMYKLAQERVNSKHEAQNPKSRFHRPPSASPRRGWGGFPDYIEDSRQSRSSTESGQKNKIENFKLSEKKIKIITAWRYPGESPERDPVPQEILGEIRNLL